MLRMALVAGLSITAAAVWAQGPAPTPTSQSPAQQAGQGPGIPPCATAAEQSAALGQKSAGGSGKLAGQPAELSGILPSAGSAGSGTSAAPTTQDNGMALRSPLDCPLIPGHPNAPSAQPPALPTISTPK
jgi:hypothetical protein